MRLSRLKYLLSILMVTAMVCCKNKPAKKTGHLVIFKGLYSFGPGEKTFRACGSGHEFWMADSSAQLELKYSQLISFEKQGEPVYVEVEGKKVPSARDGAQGAYDSTIIVNKVTKIVKDIPAGCK
jgi:copper homeostasis protein (lipoprotein)